MKVAVVGYPNVGKSSLVNRLTGSRSAVVHERAGHHARPQRDRLRVERPALRRSSTPAAWTSSTSTRSPARSASRPRRRSTTPWRRSSSSTRAPGAGPGDEELADLLRRWKRPVILAANKVDSVGDMALAADFHALGLGDPLAVSATQGLERRRPARPRRPTRCPTRATMPEEEDDAIRLAIVGRPNVGKSTLVNRLLGDERVIVSDVAGTTRDAIDLPLEVDGRKLVIVDTAGLRRQAKVSDSVEYYTTLRSQRAVERADVVLVVCDAHDGVTSQDLRIAELAMKEGCATALVLNKWDVAAMDEADLDHERARVAQKLRLRPKVLTASAHDRAQRPARAQRGDHPRRPDAQPHPDAAAQPLPGRGRPGAPAAGQAGPPAQAALHGAVRDRAAALLDPGQLAQPRHARLRLLHREPPARPLRDGRRAADHRLQRAQAAPRASLAERPRTPDGHGRYSLRSHEPAFRQRVPVHVRVRHRGPPRQDRRPDLRRRPRRGAARRPLRARGLRDAREHGPRRRVRRDLDHDLRRHPGRRARDDPQDRLHRRRPGLQRRLVRGHQRDRQAVARHRPGRRPGLRGAHRRLRRRRSSTSPARATRG